MLKIKYIKSRQVSKVTFTLPRAELPGGIEVETVNLVGEFNDWDHTSTPMELNSRGTFSATLELEPERAYQFRYLVNGEHWYNEWHADAYIPSGFGKDNCIVNTEIEE
jgi:1,4-alpha-glucan branching enzyme